RRCRVLLHLIDSTSPDPVTDFELIEGEVRTYDPRLEQVTRVVVATKADIDSVKAEASARALSEHLGKPVRAITVLEEQCIEDLRTELMALVTVERATAVATPPEEVPVLRPGSQERFAVHRGGDGRFVVEGYRVVQFVEMMETDMEGSRAEVDRRLDR
ncbi:MAG: hypothetical protein CO095_11070, partial [Armatimonadetes bacterium CG_4_9_14_3_um_filter_58_7]